MSGEDAVRAALAETARSVRGIADIDVVQLTATVEGDSIKSYRAKVKVSHLVESRILSGLPR